MKKVSDKDILDLLQKEIQDYEKTYRRLGINGEFEIEVSEPIYNLLLKDFDEDYKLFGWKVRLVCDDQSQIRLVRKMELEVIKVELGVEKDVS